MPLFKDQGGSLKKLKIEPLAKERNLQVLVEQNLLEVLEMYFLATEYPTTFGGRIDTLAIDSNGAPVIIEYKLNRNDNVINQALSYLRWLKAQKMEFFEMLVLKKLGKEIAEKIKIDWGNPRVVCIAESYSKYDIDTVEVIPIRLELFKYRYYQDGIFYLEALSTMGLPDNEMAKPKKDNLISRNVVSKVLNETTQTQTQQIFEELRRRILEIDESIVEKTTSAYVAYRVAKNFAEIHIGRRQININLRPTEYEDPLLRVEKVPDSYRWTLSSRFSINSMDDIDYALKLVEQSYKDVL